MIVCYRNERVTFVIPVSLHIYLEEMINTKYTVDMKDLTVYTLNECAVTYLNRSLNIHVARATSQGSIEIDLL